MPTRNMVKPSGIMLRFLVLSAIIPSLMPLMSASALPETIIGDGLDNFEAEYQVPNSAALGDNMIVATGSAVLADKDDKDKDKDHDHDDEDKDKDHDKDDHHDHGNGLSGPVARAQSITTDEDKSINIVLDGSDDDGDAISFSIVADPQHGRLGELNLLTGTVSYDPSRDYHGRDSFTFIVNDGTSDSQPATVTIDVSSVNDAPISLDGEIQTRENAKISFSLTARDADNDTLTYQISTSPAHGSLTGTAPNLVYAPYSNFDGLDSITFKANDGTTFSNVANLLITVKQEKDDRERRNDVTKVEEKIPASNSTNTNSTIMIEGAVDDSPVSAVNFDPFAIAKTMIINSAASQSETFGLFVAQLGEDFLAPRLILPTSPVEVLATTRTGAHVTYTVQAVDDKDGEITPFCSPSSGSSFPVGRVNVLCKATDSAGNVALQSFIVVVMHAGDQVDAAVNTFDAAYSFLIPTIVIGGLAAAYGGFRVFKRAKSA